MRTGFLLVLCLFTLGCGSGARIAKANDGLRLEREAQRERIESLEAENAELRVRLSEANARAESPLPDDVVRALPRVASIELTRFSGLHDAEIVWSVRPSDGRGRFVQAVGTLELRAVSAGESPAVLAEAILPPVELRDALTTGLTGAGYRVTRPIEGDAAGPITLTATLHDHVTGATHEASRALGAR